MSICNLLGYIWQPLCLDHVNSNAYAKVYQNIPKGSRDRASFTFFRIWTSAKPRPIPNVIWQSHRLHIVNINVHAKFHHSIPFSSRNRAIFTFSEFGTRQSLDRWKMSFPKLLGYILSISIFIQTFIKIFHSVQQIGPFSLFQNLALGKASTDDKCHFEISWARCCHCQYVCKKRSNYSKWFTSYQHFSRTVRGQNLHKKAGDKIFTNYPVIKSNVWL